MENIPWKSFYGISMENFFHGNFTWAKTRKLHEDSVRLHVKYSTGLPWKTSSSMEWFPRNVFHGSSMEYKLLGLLKCRIAPVANDPYIMHFTVATYSILHTYCIVFCGGSAVGRWTCDLPVAVSIPGRWRSRNIGQLSLASLLGR